MDSAPRERDPCPAVGYYKLNQSIKKELIIKHQGNSKHFLFYVIVHINYCIIWHLMIFMTITLIVHSLAIRESNQDISVRTKTQVYRAYQA